MAIDFDHFQDRIRTRVSGVITQDDTGALRVASGTTAQRPGVGLAGMIRFNTTTSKLELHDGSTWRDILAAGQYDSSRIRDIDNTCYVDVDDIAETVLFFTSGFERMRLDLNGRLGIGMAPVSPLSVQVGNQEQIYVNAGTSPDVGTFAALTAATATIWLQDQNTLSNRRVGVRSSGDSLALLAAGAEVLRCDSTGRVGIGTSTPTVALDIASTGACRIPVGTTAQQPAAQTGLFRFNTDFDAPEYHDSSKWQVVASREYVDALAGGLSWKEPVVVKDTSPADTAGYTYNPAAEGGATALVWTGVGAPPTWDTYTMNDGDRILITNAADPRGNGVFVYDQVAQGFRRAPDQDSNPGNEVKGGVAVFVSGGFQFQNTGWVISAPDGVATLGVSSISWVQFTGTATYTASNGIILVGTDFQLTGQASELHNLPTVGLITRTSLPNITTRTIQGLANEIAVFNGDGDAADPTIGIAPNPIIPGTEKIRVPVGLVANRPAAPAAGDLRFATDTTHLEYYDGSAWQRFGPNGDFVLRAGDTMLGGLGFVGAAAPNPGLYVVGDTDTGIASSGADTLSLSVGGTNMLALDRANGTIVADTGTTANAIHVLADGRIGLGVVPTFDLQVSRTGAILISKGTTAQRPAGPVSGLIRFNTSTSEFEGHDGSGWQAFVTSAGATPRYVQNILLADWTGPVAGQFSITVTAAVHGRGTNPLVQVFGGAAAPRTLVMPDEIEVAANGDVTIRVSENPDGRFEGQVVLI